MINKLNQKRIKANLKKIDCSGNFKREVAL